MTHDLVTANGISFAYWSWGPAGGPLALLLHGFPDTPHTWRHLGPELADDGWRVIAPWLRGSAPTEIPAGRVWRFGGLASDVTALHEALGGDERAVLVGHDWGAMLGHRAAARAPERWQRVVGLAIPPEPSAFATGVRGYFLAAPYLHRLQLPGAARRLRRGDGDWIRQLWRQWSPGYQATVEDLRPAIEAIGTPEGARMVLAYYRGIWRGIVAGTAFRPWSPRPPQPSLYLHGADDGCFSLRDIRPVARRLPPGSTAELLPDVGHFLHLEDPVGVNARIRAFVAA